MSECVVRMEMPENCFECPFSIIDDTADGAWCNALAKQVYYDRHEDCPIICILPEGHGRLVDADAFSGHMKEYQEKIMEWRERSKTEGPEESYHRADSSLLTVVATKLILDNAPTIVPAERSET